MRVSNHTALSSSSSSGIISRALILVASKSTGHALPWLRASSHVLAHTHQESPGFKPGKLNCGAGVIRSFPFERANSRKSGVTIQQTVCDPLSISSVFQLPSLYQPVIGLQEHSPMSCPRTFCCDDMFSRREIATSNCVWIHSLSSPRRPCLTAFFSKNSMCELTERKSSSAHFLSAS